MMLVDTFTAARAATIGVVALVPTMGFLHEGHLSLVRRAADGADCVLVSLFVNPLQFGPGEDLDRYPRDLDRDRSAAAAAGADVLFAPSVGEMYPAAPRIRVTAGEIGGRFEGAARPGHFDGVVTVVAKLLAGLRPDLAWFGAKDAQQFAVVSRLVADLSFPVAIRRGSTVRDPDGLALSSRNIFLAGGQRTAAVALSRGLFAAADAAEDGIDDGRELEAMAAAVVTAQPGIDLEYVALVDAETVARAADVRGGVFLAAAARVGTTRLIDNVWLRAGDDGISADRGVLLDRPSQLLGEEGN
jgi:pantoate--beta-alanine ligase